MLRQDLTLKRLLDAGADPNTENLDRHTLLGIALRENKPRCRKELEERGAEADAKWQDGDRERPPRRDVSGRGLKNPGGLVWATLLSILNNIFSFWLHYSRGSDPHSLTDNTQYHDGKVEVGKSVASSAEANWMYAYARIVYPRTMS